MFTITAKEIQKEKYSFETCEYVDTIFDTLYDSEKEEIMSKEEYLDTLPEELQVGVILSDFLGPDSLIESISHFVLYKKDEASSLWWQKKVVWALEKIKEHKLALLVSNAINQYKASNNLDKEIEEMLSNIDPHSDVIYDPLAKYIKEHAEKIVTREYLEKAKEQVYGPAKNSKKYQDKLKNQYSWFKI